jgi:nicotinate-nucleotide pyrophosphorylase (carboxylating)
MIPSEPGFSRRLDDLLDEDLGSGDVTSEAVVPTEARARGSIRTRSDGVVSGLDVARSVFARLDPTFLWNSFSPDGSPMRSGESLAELSGNARAILSAERLALNLLQRMSGIATLTRRFVDAVAGTRCAVLDTRKTAPGLRPFDRIAVRAGGGRNHRFSLAHGILVKDNHIQIAGGIAAAVAAARSRAPAGLRVEVEVEDKRQFDDALAAGADVILFDNLPAPEVSRLVSIARARRPEVLLEASGGITLANVAEYARTGVDFVSVGALTHSAPAADIALELFPE